MKTPKSASTPPGQESLADLMTAMSVASPSVVPDSEQGGFVVVNDNNNERAEEAVKTTSARKTRGTSDASVVVSSVDSFCSENSVVEDEEKSLEKETRNRKKRVLYCPGEPPKAPQYKISILSIVSK